MSEPQRALFHGTDLQAVMERRHELFRRAVLGGEEALLPAFRQANREYVRLRNELRSKNGL
jgi:hypothetical protein